MATVKILLAGPGTGKTTKVKEIIKAYPNVDKVLILSFTNATIFDLLEDFKKDGIGVDETNCMTLHKYAAKTNHLTDVHILNTVESRWLDYYATRLGIAFPDLCRMLGCMTFEDLIASCTNFIKTNSAAAQRNIGEIDLLIVDEFQDFNEVERNFITAVSQFANEVFILGDDDQCIYGFKNADSDGIIALYDDTGVEKVEHDNICYRCPDDIVKAGNALIGRNTNRIGKDWNLSGKTGELIQHQSLDETAHNNYLVQQIVEIKKTDPQGTIMIISPISFGVKSLTEGLTNAGIPFVNWWDNKTEMDMMNKVWMLRAIFGNKKLLNLMMLAYQSPKRATSTWKKFLTGLQNEFQHGGTIETLIESASDLGLIDPQLAGRMLTPSDFEEFFQNNPDFLDFKEHIANPASREKNLEKLEQKIKTPIIFDRAKVNILSIFKSKGLQADYVFITDLVDGILPRDATAMDAIEAERRLLFVGVSRARKMLYLLSTVLYEGQNAHKANFAKFKYDHRTKKYTAQTSLFVSELLQLAITTP